MQMTSTRRDLTTIRWYYRRGDGCLCPRRVLGAISATRGSGLYAISSSTRWTHDARLMLCQNRFSQQLEIGQGRYHPGAMAVDVTATLGERIWDDPP